MQQDLQKQFFNAIRQETGEGLAEQLADLLNISTDSAYRRLRGETSLTLSEIQKLSKEYKLSLDEVINPDTKTVSFNYNWILPEEFNYDQFLIYLKNQLDSISVFEEHEVVTIAKDIPLFYYFLIPEIAAFKSFYWRKSILGQEATRNDKFDLEALNDEHIRMGNEIVTAWTSVSSTELWNSEILTGTLSQIEYYYESGYFVKPYHADKLLDKVEQMVDHLHEQADYGCKHLIGKEPNDRDNFNCYHSELFMGDNAFLLKRGEQRTVYLGQNLINIIFTTNPDFCRQTEEVQQNFIRGAQPISKSNEKSRNKFFNGLKGKIERLRNSLL